MRQTRASLAVASVAITAAALVVYHRALSAFFLDDDFQWLVWSWSFRPSQLVAFGGMGHFYRPVIVVYFAAATRLFGRSPMMFHLVNVSLHIANGLVVLAVARMVGRMTGLQAGRDLQFGFLAALFFVVQPSDVDTIAWVGALAEAVGTFFGCLSLLAFLKWRQNGLTAWRALSISAFALALLTHESSVMFLPLIVVAAVAGDAGAPGEIASRRTTARVSAPYLALTALYLAVDLPINSRNYVIGQGHYTVGVHIARNALDDIQALYVGRRDLANHVGIAIAIGLLLFLGNPRVRFATLWLLLALAPFLPFTWSDPTRYLYQPAIGFSMLLSEGVMQVDRMLTGILRPRIRYAAVSGIVCAITVRFMIFATANVATFASQTELYRSYLARFRQIHGNLPAHATVAADPRLTIRFAHRFANAAVQWEYGDATIQIAPYDDRR